MGCQQALVTIQTVSVAKSESYGVFGEPGASAEWDLRFNVAGLGAAIRYDGVKDGTVLTVNQPFLVDLGPLESLLVQVSGKEIDDSSANDGLPTAKLKITPATNWSEGQSFTFSAPSHDDFAYDVTCDIRCATTSLTSGVHDILPRQDGWRWCHKCTGLWFAGSGEPGACPTGGGHDTAGSGNYALVDSIPGAPGQSDWRWCRRCMGLWFNGGGTRGACPTGGGHDLTGSGDYTLLDSVADAPGQHDWRWCHKCTGLWFQGGGHNGSCPGGGAHESAGSGDYILFGA